MAWIEAHQGLAQHPKTKRMARMLGISTAEAIGHLFMLWWWAMDYAQDGDLSKYDEFDIADAAQWTGDAKTFLDAVKNCGPGDSSGFIDERDGGLFLHDWNVYAGRLFNMREQNRERQARHKEQKKNEAAREQRDGNADITDASRVSNALVTREQVEDNAPVTRYEGVSNALITGLHNITNITNITEQNQHNKTEPSPPTPPTPPTGGGACGGVAQPTDSGEAAAKPQGQAEAHALAENPPNGERQEGPHDFGAAFEAVAVPACTFSQVAALWNERLGPLGFPRVSKSTPAREKAFHARLSEQVARRDLQWWRERIAQLAASDFMRSSAIEKANWLTFDWLLNENNLVKVVEGKYDNGRAKPGKSGESVPAPPCVRDAPMTYEEAVAKYRGSSAVTAVVDSPAMDAEFSEIEEG